MTHTYAFALACFSLIFVLGVHAQQDHYSVLGVARSASEDEIKKAFKKLARKLHPDAQRGLSGDQMEAARKRFMAISDAYEVLADKKKREAYDNYGGRTGGSGDERMFLRQNLFAHDFDGEQLDAAEVEKALNGQLDQTLMLFMWSGNIPDCIDPGLDYKRVAQRLVGSSVRVAAMRCDDMNYQMCRFGLQVPNLPALTVIPARAVRRYEHFTGKFEFHAMTEFGAKFLKEHQKRVKVADMASLVEMCPNPAASPELSGHRWAAPYFVETWKRSVGHQWSYDFVALEFSPCFDCDTELNIAVEMLAPVMPDLYVRKIRCDFSRNRKLCNDLASRQADRAWTVLRLSQRCYYATKKPFVFSDEHCDAVATTVYQGKYNSGDFAQFMLQGQPSHLLRLDSLHRIKQHNDSYAVLMLDKFPATQSEFIAASPTHRHWEILARQVNTYKPVRGSKGYRLHIAVMDCSVGVCDRHPQRNQVLLFPFGTKAKQLPPIVYDRVAGAGSIMAAITTDMEPLHLHVLTANTWKSKVADSIEKGRKWVILFNAGQWCPPCSHIRPNWKQTARIIQNSPASSKLSVAVVECDEQKVLCQQQGIQNYPTVYFYSKGRDRMAFNGNREANAMSAWAMEAIDSRLQRLDFRELQMMMQRGATFVISFTAGQWCPPCMHLSGIYKQVANRLSDTIVTETNCDEEQWVCNQFGIQGYPTIVVYHRGARHEFNGNKGADQIVQWVQGITRS